MSEAEEKLTAFERASRAMAPLLNPEPHPYQVQWSEAHSMSTERLHGMIEAEIVTAMDDARREGYREWVEESAKVADKAAETMTELANGHPEESESRWRCVARAREAISIAAAIRQLSGTSEGKG